MTQQPAYLVPKAYADRLARIERKLDSASFAGDGVTATNTPTGLTVTVRSPRPPSAGPRTPPETIFARLAGVTDDAWAWAQVQRADDGTWAAVDGGLSGTADVQPAYDLPRQTSAADQVVILKRATVLGETEPEGEGEPTTTRTPAWVIIAPVPDATARYQVLTTLDDTFRWVATTPRFSD